MPARSLAAGCFGAARTTHGVCSCEARAKMPYDATNAMRVFVCVALVVAACPGCKRSRAGTDAPAASETVSPAPPGRPSTDPAVDEIRDGDLFSLTIPASLRACFAFPAARFDASKCPPGTKTIDASKFPAKTRPLAIAFFRSGMDGGGTFLQLSVSMTQADHAYQPVPATAKAWARGILKSIPTSFPGGTVRGDESRVRILTAHGLTVARFAYDVDGLSGTYKRFEHDVTYAIWSPEGAYTYSISSVAPAAADADSMADEIVASVRIAHLAPQVPPGLFER